VHEKLSNSHQLPSFANALQTFPVFSQHHIVHQLGSKPLRNPSHHTLRSMGIASLHFFYALRAAKPRGCAKSVAPKI
jgi:hypothetical protein